MPPCAAGKTNIIGTLQDHPNVYIIDFALLPKADQFKPLTAEEAQALVKAAVAKAGSGTARAPATAPTTAPPSTAGRR